MDDLVVRIKEAKVSQEAMGALVADYLPFLKKEIGGIGYGRLSYDERLSLAMLVFVNCIRQYDESRGNFISFLSASVKYRLIDQLKAMEKESRVISLDGKSGGSESDFTGTSENSIEQDISIQNYKKEEEENRLREEIAGFNEELEKYSLSFSQLKNNCPRQKRSRKLCIKLAKEIADNSDMKKSFLATGRLPQRELSLKMGVSAKTVEKYRKYIVALTILLVGDYFAITSFIPYWDEETE